MHRRRFLQAAASGLLGGTLLPAGAVAAANDRTPVRLRAAPGEYRLHPTKTEPATLMQFNASIPGPVLRIPRGRETLIRFDNALDEPSSVHWHGLRIANAMDGVPGMTQPAVEPGQSFDYVLNPPDAGTYWYHTHLRSWAQMALGLAGVLIVEEDTPPAVDRDLVIAIDDWRIDREGRFDAVSLGHLHDWSHAGRIGNLITVNGKTGTRYAVRGGERIRLRLVNIANARTMTLQINEPLLQVVAIDGQPVEPFAPRDGRLTLAVGQRVDVVVDFAGAPGQSSTIELLVRDNAYAIVGFDYGNATLRDSPLESPLRLPPNPLHRIALPDEFLQVPLRLQGGAMSRFSGATVDGREMTIPELVERKLVWAMNGVAGLPEAPLFRVARGTAVSLELDNDTSWPHAMHLHGHHFVRASAPGIWRDTVLLERGERDALRFVADNPGRWLIHCHMAEHMAGGMLSWFEVT